MRKFKRYIALFLAIFSVLLLFSSCGMRKASEQELAAYFYMRSIEKATSADSVTADSTTVLRRVLKEGKDEIESKSQMVIWDMGLSTMKAKFNTKTTHKTGKKTILEKTITDKNYGFASGMMFLSIEGGKNFVSDIDADGFLEITRLDSGIFDELSAGDCGIATYSKDESGNKNIKLGDFLGEAEKDIKEAMASTIPIRTKAINIKSANIEAVLSSDNMLTNEKINIEFDVDMGDAELWSYVFEVQSNYVWDEATEPEISDITLYSKVSDVTALDYASRGLIKLSMLDTNKLIYEEKIEMGHNKSTTAVSETISYSEINDKFSYTVNGKMSDSSQNEITYSQGYTDGTRSSKIENESKETYKSSDAEEFLLIVSKYFYPMIFSDERIVKSFEMTQDADGSASVVVDIDLVDNLEESKNFLNAFGVVQSGINLTSAKITYSFNAEGELISCVIVVKATYKAADDPRGPLYNMVYQRSVNIINNTES